MVKEDVTYFIEEEHIEHGCCYSYALMCTIGAKTYNEAEFRSKEIAYAVCNFLNGKREKKKGKHDKNKNKKNSNRR